MEKQLLNSFDHLPDSARGGVLTIGNFDGVHLGHQRILLRCRTLAHEVQRPVVVLTFDPLPEYVLRPHEAPPFIVPPARNGELLLKHGADLVVMQKIDPGFLHLTPREFVEQVVVGRFAPRHIVEGQDFFFGRARMGSVETLSFLGAELGFETHVIDSVTLMFRQGQRRVSSTLIRELITQGDVAAANDSLGRKFTLYGAVVGGDQRGRLLGFPTLNVDPGEQVMPGDGVYAAAATVDGTRYLSAVSVGTRPTFHPDSRKHVIEAFLIDASGDFYGKQVELVFHSRLRPQQKFNGADALKTQIAADVEAVRRIVQ